MSIFLSLFLKLSTFSLIAFGGVNALLPSLLNLSVYQEHWIDLQTFADYFAIAQAAPGPNFMTVTLIGWHVYGVLGGADCNYCYFMALLYLGVSLAASYPKNER
ncbi:chromate transporter [Polynucleobacter necessarius]|uniref:chromate transporter n=1 Tax=Polynucleobacter necessarius TaxID=576610 RepID=UPI0018D541ED|nr:chromate transporter [Polynucleobacter necessarius]